ncbi:MAG TPA: hypothetical protein VG013_30815 [Gemmataceae bacterium]|jgi:hypothetical protein|nr:hypothetical protein [Gemmataceae bacterium]
MGKRKDDKPGRRRKDEDQELRDLYAKMRQEFTAADLQKYTEVEEGIPADEVLAEMEAIQRKYARKKG